MRDLRLYNAVLFSIEKGPYPYKYRLYFAAKNKNSEPELHRFFVRSKKVFEEFIIGGVYNLDYSGMRIKSASYICVYPLNDTEYFDLIRLRDRQFMDDKAQHEFSVHSRHYSPADHYYTFDVYKSLMDMRPPLYKRLLVNLIKLACYLLSFFIPIGVYLLTVYFFSASALDSSKTVLTAFTVPLLSILLLPFIIWMMCALYTMFNYLLLNMPYARNLLLKQYTLKWAGMRKSCFFEDDIRKKIFNGGIITFAIAILSVIAALIF